MSKKEDILRKVAEMETKEKMVSRIYDEIESLVKVFEKKEASEAITEMGETDKETWRFIQSATADLKEFVGLGGISKLREGIKEQMELSIMQPLAPLINEIIPLITPIVQAFEPIIDTVLVPLVSWLSDVLRPIIEWIAGAIQWLIDFFTAGWEFRAAAFMDWEKIKDMLFGEGEGEYPERILDRPPRRTIGGYEPSY